MNTGYEQEPFSASEFAAGGIALAAVAVIALIGVTMSRPESSSRAAAAPPGDAALVVASPATAGQSPDSSGMPREQQRPDPPAAPDSLLARRADAYALPDRGPNAAPVWGPNAAPVWGPTRALMPPAPEAPAETTSAPVTAVQPAEPRSATKPAPVTARQPVESRSATTLSARLLDILRAEDPEDAPPQRLAPEAPAETTPAPVTSMQPVEERNATRLSARLLDLLRAEDPGDAPPRRPAQGRPVQGQPVQGQPAPESPWQAAPERNPLNRSDATSIQQRLHVLGYYFGDEKGVWGAASRKGLREFKRMNGLQDDDKWDRETEERLLSGPGVRASRTFIGRWAVDADECLDRADGNQVVINSRGAETAGGKCDFRSFKQETANSWRIRAVCSTTGKSWSADIGLRLVGPHLHWSSERGVETYVRCLKT